MRRADWRVASVLPAPRGARAGFVLVEVLAALVVTTALVAVVLPVAAKLLSRWWTGQPEIERADDIMQAVARLGDDIAEAVPLSVAGGRGPTRLISVEPKRLVLLRPALDGGTRLDLVIYEVSNGTGGDTLTRATRPYRPGDPFPPAAVEQAGAVALIEGGPRLGFDARGAAGPWSPGKEMPGEIDLSVRAPGPARTRTPLESVLPPRLVFPIGAGGG